MVRNNNKIAILKNTTTPKFKDLFRGFFVLAMEKEFKKSSVKFYNLSLYDPIKLQTITRDLVRASIIRAAKSWHRSSVRQVKELIDQEVKSYRTKRDQIKTKYRNKKSETDERSEKVEFDKIHDNEQHILRQTHLATLRYFEEIIDHMDTLNRNSLDKVNINFIEVLNIKDYVY